MKPIENDIKKTADDNPEDETIDDEIRRWEGE